MRKRACDSCHRRKIQCDGAVPQCNWCKHHGMACTFNRATKVKKRVAAARAGSEKDLVERLNRIEQALEAARRNQGSQDPGNEGRDPSMSPSSSSAPMSSVGPEPMAADGTPEATQARALEPPAWASGATVGKMHFAGYYLGDISSHNGVPFFSSDGQEWIRSRTGEDASIQTLFALGPLWQTQHPVPIHLGAYLHSNSGRELPDRTVVEEYLALFRASHFGLFFPLIDHTLFLETIELAFQPSETPSLETITAKACVFAFFAVLSLFQVQWKSTPEIDGEACAGAAQNLIPIILQETNITGLETVFMLSLYRLFCGHLQQGAMFHSTTCRVLFMLGGHLNPGTSCTPYQSPKTGHDHDSLVRNQLRRLFWLAYKLDKDISLRTGQPPSIDDEYCDLVLPQNDWWTRNSNDLGGSPSFLDEAMITSAIQPDSLQLTIIKSTISRTLYSVAAMKKGDAELLRDIRELDDGLERWRMSVPQSYRPTLTFPRGTVAIRNGRMGMEEIIMHFEYHYLMAMIHRASGRCRCWASGEGGGLEGVSSSLALSVQASRSTLYFLKAAIHAVEEVAFWMIVFYPMSAILTIFCSLLHDPLNPQAEEDLQLLQSVPQLIEGMRNRRLTKYEVGHVKMIDAFVAELTRLGNCAIGKARREETGE
ncbi:fungal specific transcription factor [Colletotrichum truncatum]|uniref:Fungal specific transcription factor n=1 Tax=Colletotrichum truncatum TaxID=5467 RepID=A0ACC3YZF9_COLTU|nr:fungal specific transcription factor [Colletotrichum truncatum]KAF6786241.1 fungal specific transcription factor [Colletotrichum truncatum]